MSHLTSSTIDTNTGVGAGVEVLAPEPEVAVRTDALNQTGGVVLALTIVVAPLALGVARRLRLAIDALEFDVAPARVQVVAHVLARSTVLAWRHEARIDAVARDAVETAGALALEPGPGTQSSGIPVRYAHAAVSTRLIGARILTLAHVAETAGRTDAAERERGQVLTGAPALARAAPTRVHVLTPVTVVMTFADALEFGVRSASAPATVLARIDGTRIEMLALGAEISRVAHTCELVTRFGRLRLVTSSMLAGIRETAVEELAQFPVVPQAASAAVSRSGCVCHAFGTILARRTEARARLNAPLSVEPLWTGTRVLRAGKVPTTSPVVARRAGTRILHLAQPSPEPAQAVASELALIRAFLALRWNADTIVHAWTVVTRVK